MGRCPWLERAKKALPFCVLEPGRRTITRYFLTRGNGMARKVLRLTPPPASEPDSTEQKRPAPERKPLPSREEVNAWISELEAQLASDDAKAVTEATLVCRRLSLRAAQRLGLIITGAQQGTVPQIVMASIAILKGAGIMKGDAGIVAETTTERAWHEVHWGQAFKRI
jgi:hypothetical protein